METLNTLKYANRARNIINEVCHCVVLYQYLIVLYNVGCSEPGQG